MPAIEPKDWSLRIHGKVDREITLSYADLVDREFTEAWVTLCCVSNEVGGDLISNAWFSGVRLAELLAQAGPTPTRTRCSRPPTTAGPAARRCRR